MSTPSVDVCVVGAGLAGLSCANYLTQFGLETRVLEASDGVGGRVRTDVVDGYRLDRGFQILLTQYPEANLQLDMGKLKLKPFDPGLLIYTKGDFHKVSDPMRRPSDLISTLRAPIGSIFDKARLGLLFLDVRRTSPQELMRRLDRSTLEELQRRGFSERMIKSFWQPLFAGIQLDPDLEVSAKRFALVMAMIAEGDAAVPELGIGAISDQLAAKLPSGIIELETAVTEITSTGVRVDDGREIDARAVVVATESPAAARLIKIKDPGSRPVANLQFSAPQAPVDDRLTILNGTGDGPVTNLAIMSNVAPTYAPPNRSLISIEVPGVYLGDDRDLLTAVTAQMRDWFGGQVNEWELLRNLRIEHGHPNQLPGFSPKKNVRLGEYRYVCGDHRDTASSQGALYSGRRTASAVIADLSTNAQRK